MKGFAVLLLLACVLPVAAQHTEIIDFTTPESLTWTNIVTNTYCAIEWTLDLNWNWIPFDQHALWDMPTTSATQTVELPADAIQGVDWLIPEMDRRWDSHFFRIRSGTNSIPLPPMTNYVTFVNSSTSILQGISIGTVWSSAKTEVTNIPALPVVARVNTIAVVIPFIHIWDTSLPVGEELPSHGWYVSYLQDGTAHEFGSSIFEFGPADRDVTVTVSNESFTIWWEWLEWGSTTEY